LNRQIVADRIIRVANVLNLREFRDRPIQQDLCRRDLAGSHLDITGYVLLQAVNDD
jgi:hypothetical protein